VSKGRIKQKRVKQFLKSYVAHRGISDLEDSAANTYYLFGKHILELRGVIGGLWDDRRGDRELGPSKYIIEIALKEYEDGKDYFTKKELIEWIICEYSTPLGSNPGNNLLALEKLVDCGLTDKKTRLVIEKYAV